MRALIVDDEPTARQYLGLILGRIGGVEVVGEAADAEEAFTLCDQESPEMVFLDIRLPGMSGLEVAQALNGTETPPWIIFTTGYDEYAVQAFEAAAVDYVMKPYDQERIERALQRVQKLRSEGQESAQRERASEALDRMAPKLTKLPIRVKDVIKLIPPEDILFVEARGKRVFVHARGVEYPAPYTVTRLEQKLVDYNFFRANEGCLVNMDKVKEIVYLGERSYELLMNDKNETHIELSRSRARALREVIKEGM
ncbi:MAG TPA: LytTR family DNA-binding domain-containing protein [Armatimonadota bacterium]|jgi:DNA-binding LytR/AlgR family response regulator